MANLKAISSSATLTKVFYTYGSNLVILAWTGDELSRGQASDYRTHGRTDGRTHRQTQATTIPEGQNWPRVKTEHVCDIVEIPQSCMATAMSRPPAQDIWNTESTEGGWPISDAH